MQFGFYLISYLLGNFMTAKIISLFRGVNIQQQGSGNVGARNAGRVLGKTAFFLTVIGDAGKVLLVMVIGHLLAFSTTAISFGCVLCVIGHLHPFWLKFKGGMGVATCLSALVFLTPVTAIAFIIGGGIWLVFTRSFTLSMIAGFITYSSALFFIDTEAWPLLIAIVLVIWHHRDNIRERRKG